MDMTGGLKLSPALCEMLEWKSSTLDCIKLRNQLVEAAIQEDVDLIGISVLSGAHMTIFPRIKELLKEQNAEDILLMGGGTIPEEDIISLLKDGYAEALFTPGATTTEIVSWIEEKLSPSKGDVV